MKKEYMQNELKRSKKIFDHYNNPQKGRMTQADLQQDMRENFPFLMQELQSARRGNFMVDGYMVASSNASLADILKSRYGITPQRDSEGRITRHSHEQYMESLGIIPSQMSLNDVAQKFGMDALSVSDVDSMLRDHGSLATPRSTADVPDGFRFLIPELIIEAVRTSYLHTAMYTNWIAATRAVNRLKVTMPQILSSIAMPTRINEGASVPFGQVRYGQKDVSIYKIGIGLELTEELIIQSSISDLFIFLQDVGSNMAIGSDWEALSILTDGDQPDGSESAPVLGVDDNVTGIQRKDLLRVTNRMRRLGLAPTRMIASEEMALVNVAESGTSGDFITIQNFLSNNGIRAQDIHTLAENRIMLLNAQRSMIQLRFGAMRVRSETDIRTGKDQSVITDYIGFAKVKRDASLILDGSVAYNATPGEAGAFPTYMDIDGYLQRSFLETI